MLKQITSTQNTYIKELVQLKEKSRVRKKTGLFVIEGLRETVLALNGGYKLHKVLFDSSIISYDELKLNLNLDEVEVIEISKEVYQKLALRESTEGVLAVAYTQDLSLKNLQIFSKKPLILVAEAPEKPGNIGALLRTADAAGIDAVLIANPKTDMYNPNIIRTSIGTIFTTKIATGSTSQIIDFLKHQNINIYCAALSASIDYLTINYTESSAIIVGTEATGLSDQWLQNSNQNIIISMRGCIDSMNVSVSAGIITFEALRQRSIRNND